MAVNVNIAVDIAALYERFFGMRPLRFDVANAPDQQTNGKYGTPLTATDKLGRVYWMPVQIGPSNSELMQLSFPTVSIEASVTNVDTYLTERQGSVSQYIYQNNIVIRVRGLIVGQNKQWPEEEIAALNDLKVKGVPMVLKCALTDIFLLHESRQGNDTVIINDLQLPNQRGDIKVQPYELVLSSNEHFNLEEIE